MNWKDVLRFLDARFARCKGERCVELKNGYATGYILGNGRQLAAETRSDEAHTNVWIEDVGPPVVPSHFELYKADKGRLSALSSVAPRLSGPGYGKPSHRVYKIVITSADELERLLDWYGRPDFAVREVAPGEVDSPTSVESDSMSLNTIMYGPPGTGKTYSTTSRAVQICDGELPAGGDEAVKQRFEDLRKEGRISFVTFHQSYGYEEFVEGVRPVVKDGAVFYDVTPGAFKKACVEARSFIFDGEKGGVRPESSSMRGGYVLIIDEINRANVSKVFGELITLIESDKREGQKNATSVRLPYSGEEFSVPSNLYILGTMNTADRSIALLDTALRRRFEFEELMPNPNLLVGLDVEGVDLARLLIALNERVEALYDRDHTIGHAYLMGVKSLEELDRAFRRKIIPLLQEYFYENWSQVRRVLSDFGDGDFIRRRVLPVVPSDGEQDMLEETRFVYEVNPEPFPVGAYLRIYGGQA